MLFLDRCIIFFAIPLQSFLKCRLVRNLVGRNSAVKLNEFGTAPEAPVECCVQRGHQMSLAVPHDGVHVSLVVD